MEDMLFHFCYNHSDETRLEVTAGIPSMEAGLFQLPLFQVAKSNKLKLPPEIVQC
jgi:hypothetical protein